MPCALRRSFKQTKNINILNEPGRRNLGCAFLKVETEKKRKRFAKIDFFCWRTLQKTSRFSAKKGFSDKTYSISERAEDGLSAHVFISISEFLTKIDFF